jgi:hypothetical protein
VVGKKRRKTLFVCYKKGFKKGVRPAVQSRTAGRQPDRPKQATQARVPLTSDTRAFCVFSREGKESVCTLFVIFVSLIQN